jgi:hypothetical protein
MVITDCFAFANDVSPQTPMTFLSWIILRQNKRGTTMTVRRMHVRGNQAVDGKRIDRCISINHEQIFVEGRIDSNHILDLVVDFQFERVHWTVEMDLQPMLDSLMCGHQSSRPC